MINDNINYMWNKKKVSWNSLFNKKCEHVFIFSSSTLCNTKYLAVAHYNLWINYEERLKLISHTCRVFQTLSVLSYPAGYELLF